MAELLCLPEHILELIVARSATTISRYEASWSAAALTCKRLHDLQLPGECAVVEELQGLPWLMPRLKHAKALLIDTRGSTYEAVTRTRSLRRTVRGLLKASSSLSGLRVLVLRVMSTDERLFRPLVPWIFELLLGTPKLHTLEFSVGNIPCPPILRRLPLKHLILTVRAVSELLDVLEDLGYCRLLETLSITYIQELSAPFPELPRINLVAATALRHVKLTGFVPGPSQGLALPRGCALRLHGSSKQAELWSKRWVSGRASVTVLSVCHTGTANQELPDPVLHAWPKGLENFPGLQHLHLNCVKMDKPLELSVFAHIPCLRISSMQKLAVTIGKGSWKLLELEGLRKFRLSIPNLHSFLRSVSVFTFTLPSDRLQPAESFIEACRLMGVPLYERQHQVAATTSACDGYRPITKLGNDESLVRATRLDSTVLMGNWPADPVASATRRLKKTP